MSAAVGARATIPLARRLLPFLKWWPRVDRSTLKADALAGLIGAIVVLPQGVFDQTRAAVERRLGAFPPGLRTPIVPTEDYQGSWSKAFNAPTGPATYLMGATGEIAWRDVGPLQARALADALEIQQVANRTIPQLIGDQLDNSGPFLLLLDNFLNLKLRKDHSTFWMIGVREREKSLRE